MRPGLNCFCACLLAALFLPGMAAADDALQGEIRFEPAREEISWVGQELELNLELWTTGFSFGDQLFVLPEVKGGYLMQADSSTIKLNETRGDVQWQGLRYSLLFYPQREGRLGVPPFEVQFSARAGFGSEPRLFQHQTPGLFIDARLPPGADSSALLVTTRSFSMEAAWTPPVADDGSSGDAIELKVGDALRLEVTRRAQDVPGMVFEPLPAFSIDGLAAYPDAPRVNDRINRGSLAGHRTDSITFICERAGHYTIPELRFQWWDPAQEVLSEDIIPALKLAVAENPAYPAGSESSETAWPVPDWRILLAVIVALAVLIPLLRRALPLLDPDRLNALIVKLRAFSIRQFRRWIKAPIALPPLNPFSLRKD